jgi:hypothetical protein
LGRGTLPLNTVFEAYNLEVSHLVQFYQKLNRPITYPDGMTTSLGIVYWGRDKHLPEIEQAIPNIQEAGPHRFHDLLESIRTPTRARKFAETTGISASLLRILKHDIATWLPTSVPLGNFPYFSNKPTALKSFYQLGIVNQLGLISAGKTPVDRYDLSKRAALPPATITEIVKYCDFYRTGVNLEHIRAQIYLDIGLDSWQKWVDLTSEAIIAMFTAYLESNPTIGERLVPWPKEVRNGIEWAKWHLEIFAVIW